MAGRTQDALYSEIDLELSWSEDALPQVERTKHVHGLHPYLGKFVPQLVETFLHRWFAPGDCVYDPFVGSGTTLVEANAFSAHAVGCDVSKFNCLLARVTTQYSLGSLPADRESAAVSLEPFGPGTGALPSVTPRRTLNVPAHADALKPAGHGARRATPQQCRSQTALAAMAARRSSSAWVKSAPTSR